MFKWKLIAVAAACVVLLPCLSSAGQGHHRHHGSRLFAAHQKLERQRIAAQKKAIKASLARSNKGKKRAMQAHLAGSPKQMARQAARESIKMEKQAAKKEAKHEWKGIAANAGLSQYLSLLDRDPTLSFSGKTGALYPVAQLSADKTSSDPADRLRALYFSKTYFIRDGVKYTRHSKTESGVKNYLFRRD